MGLFMVVLLIVLLVAGIAREISTREMMML